MKRLLTAALLIGGVSMIGCKGEIAIFADNPGTQITPNNVNNDNNLPTPNNINIDTCAEVDVSLGTTPLRRLTALEYNNTVRDLFPGVTLGTQTFSADEKIGNFEANILASVTLLQSEEYQNAAEAVAVSAVRDLDGLLSCQTQDEACADGFIADFGRRAYRRQLTQAETDNLKTLWTFGSTDYDFETGIRLVIEGTLQSPSFLYRVEQGDGETFNEIDQHALATRLSYFLWKSTPDTALLDLADAGELSSPEVLEAQARRMMAEPKAREAVNEVFLQWFAVDSFEGVEKDDPAFDAATISSMRDETLAFIDHVVWEDDGRIETLLTANYSFVDARTAELYGITAPEGEGMVRVDLDPTQRQGILTHPSVLSRYGFGHMPVHRGKFVREALLCGIAPAPPEVLENPPETFEGQSDRDKAVDRLEHDGCGGCHALMDPIGLAFDNYDGMGRWRDKDDSDNDVYGDGELLSTDVDGEFTGAVELGQKLVGSEQFASCVSEQFFRYAFARSASREDACSLTYMEDALAKSDGDLKEMLVSMVTTDAFRYRRNLSGE